MWWEHLTDKQSNLNENGKEQINNLLKQFPPQEIKEAMIISLGYVKPNKDCKYEKTSLEEAFSKIGGICYNRSLNPRRNKETHLINLIKKIHGDDEIVLIEEVVRNLFDELVYLRNTQLQIDIVDKMIFPIVKESDDVYDCLILIETFINEKLVK